MKIIYKIKDKNTKKICFFNKVIFQKEKHLTGTFYYLFGIPFYKRRIFTFDKRYYLFGIRILKKRVKKPYAFVKLADNNEYIYTTYHTGEIYYLMSAIKQNFERFKNIKFITPLRYLKQVIEMLDFPPEWVNEHFIYVKDFYCSTTFYCDKNGKLIHIIETDQEKGFIFDGKYTEKNIRTLIAQMLNIDEFELEKISYNKIPKDETKTIMFIPDCTFNGCMNMELLKDLISKLTNDGYKILINTKTKKYDELLSDRVEKIFLSYKDTCAIIENCRAVVGVRCGLFDCISTLANQNCVFHIIYDNLPCARYKKMRDYKAFYLNAYSLSKICKNPNIKEYYFINDTEELCKTIYNAIK